MTWSLDSGGPSALERTGWTRNFVKAGDAVLVGGFVAKKGELRGSAVNVRHQSSWSAQPAGATRPLRVVDADTVERRIAESARMQDDEARRLLSRSPWAGTVTVSTLTAGELAERSVGSAAGGFDRLGPVAVPGKGRLVVRWQSAPVVAAALLRQRYGDAVKSSRAARRTLEQEDDAYKVTVTGVPSTFGRGRDGEVETRLLGATSLTAQGKPAVKPYDVALAPSGYRLDVVFSFPRTTEFTADDREVVFSMTLGPMEVKYRFHPKDMVRDGRLGL